MKKIPVLIPMMLMTSLVLYLISRNVLSGWAGGVATIVAFVPGAVAMSFILNWLRLLRR